MVCSSLYCKVSKTNRMANESYTVFLVEDDRAIRDSLGLFLGLRGYAIAPFADAESFLKAFSPDWRGCLLVDIRMPGMDGLALQQRLRADGNSLPVIVMTGHGDVESVRQAFRAEAVDFLEKPVDHARLTAAIDESFKRQADSARIVALRAEFQRRTASLTARESEIMTMVVSGRHNREIAADLAISPRTVEVHKARVMAKLNVNSVPELVRLVLVRGADGEPL